MDKSRKAQLVEANQNALRKAAAFLEAVASLVDIATDENEAVEKAPSFDPCAPTKRMPAMEQHALALDEAVRGVATAIAKLEQADQKAVEEIPLPDAGVGRATRPLVDEVSTVKIERPEQMLELMEKLKGPPDLPPGSIVEVEPVRGPETQKMGSRTGMPPGIRNPQTFKRFHPKD